jgi:hypothetical protein
MYDKAASADVFLGADGCVFLVCVVLLQEAEGKFSHAAFVTFDSIKMTAAFKAVSDPSPFDTLEQDDGEHGHGDYSNGEHTGSFRAPPAILLKWTIRDEEGGTWRCWIVACLCDWC